jgi:hypothetical protein
LLSNSKWISRNRSTQSSIRALQPASHIYLFLSSKTFILGILEAQGKDKSASHPQGSADKIVYATIVIDESISRRTHERLLLVKGTTVNGTVISQWMTQENLDQVSNGSMVAQAWKRYKRIDRRNRHLVDPEHEARVNVIYEEEPRIYSYYYSCTRIPNVNDVILI